MTTTENTPTTRRRRRGAVASVTLVPVLVLSGIVTVGGIVLQLVGLHGLRHIWMVPVAAVLALGLGWSCRVVERIRTGQPVHPVARVVAFPMLVVAILLFALVAVVALVDPHMLGIR